jgi:hypothetical protein
VWGSKKCATNYSISTSLRLNGHCHSHHQQALYNMRIRIFSIDIMIIFYFLLQLFIWEERGEKKEKGQFKGEM